MGYQNVKFPTSGTILGHGRNLQGNTTKADQAGLRKETGEWELTRQRIRPYRKIKNKRKFDLRNASIGE